MDISMFSRKFYISAEAIRGITSQHKFIGELFQACGSDFFPKDIKVDDKQYWASRSLFSGRRKLSAKMKDSFPSEIDEIKFCNHFKNRINEKALYEIAKEFSIDTKEINKEIFLIALCKQIKIIIQDESDADIVKEEYNKLLLSQNNGREGTADAETYSNEYGDQLTQKGNQKPKRNLINLWLPDAELATEEQSGFGSFTSTVSSREFMDPESSIWGIRSAKGVGKTYLLQKMRRDMNMYAIPHYHKLSKENEWGTESVRFDNPTLLEKADIVQLAGLWRASILCLVINCIGDYENKSKIISEYKTALSNDVIQVLNNAKIYNCLNEIINKILTNNNWRATIQTNCTNLRVLCKQIINVSLDNVENSEDPILIFIDKVDQAVLQPGAEIPECDNCYKDTQYDNCKKGNKDIDYCLEQCRGCCFGCEKFSSSYAGDELRIYGSRYGKRYEHISQWQHLQLALVIAVNNIRLEFQSKIQVYYAIRQEALNVEENILGANAPKIKAHTRILHYSKDEQEQIFYNTIKIQPSNYLYNPNLIEKGMYAEAFVGINRLCHPYVVGKDESLFECIYRHSFDRAREIQYIGEALALKIEEIKNAITQKDRAEIVKRTIESTAANLLFLTSGNSTAGNRTYYNDKQILLRNYWANPDNFKNFIQEIDRNLLFMDDLTLICKKINNNSNCNGRCKELNCEHHPFSMLYQIGLLGRASFNRNINNDSEQFFVPSKDVTYYRDKAEIFPDNETLFILHPALTKCIEQNIRGGGSIMHFTGFILGRGFTIPRNKHQELLKNKRCMDKKSFEVMYYSKVDLSPIN